MDEPRAVPRPDGVMQMMYYCLDCGFSGNAESYVKSHWASVHAADTFDSPMLGVDYCQGSTLLLMQIRRDEWIDQQARQFAGALHSGFTVDDFVAEAEIGDA